VWKGDGEGEVGEACYVGDAADMMDDYQQSGDESDLEQDVANEDYVVEEPDDFDVTLPLISFCHLCHTCTGATEKCSTEFWKNCSFIQMTALVLAIYTQETQPN